MDDERVFRAIGKTKKACVWDDMYGKGWMAALEYLCEEIGVYMDMVGEDGEEVRE